MKKIFLFVLFNAVFIGLSSNSIADVLAIVGDKKITQEDFDSKYKEVISKTINPPTKAQFLEDLIRYEVGLQESTKRGIQNDPIVKERINQEIYKGLLEKELSNEVEKIQVNEEAMKEYYNKNPEIRTSHILIQFKPGATSEEKISAQKRAKEILSEIKSSKRPFKDLVRLYTDDSFNKENGGDVGWQTRVTLVPNYYDAAMSLKLNQISDLVETQFGYHIIQLTGIRKYDEANKAQIRAAVFDEKRKKIFNKYFDELKKKYAIKHLKKPD